jgi:hypothetical protein
VSPLGAVTINAEHKEKPQMQTAGYESAADIPAQFLNARCETLHHYSASLRTESRRIAADAQKSRRQSRELVQQWRAELAHAKELRTIIRSNKQHQMTRSTPSPAPLMIPTAISASAAIAPLPTPVSVPIAPSEYPMVATARRVPWRRMQIDDLDDSCQLWVADEPRT